jgi:hypothetical protein
MTEAELIDLVEAATARMVATIDCMQRSTDRIIELLSPE